MRATALFISFMVFVAVTGPVGAQDASPPANGQVVKLTFEHDLDGWNAGTTRIGEWDPVWQRVTDRAAGGFAAVRVIIVGNEIAEPALSYFEYLRRDGPRVAPGVHYLFEAESWTTDPRLMPRLRVVWFDSAGGTLGEFTEPADAPTPARQWVHHSISGEAPTGAALVAVRLQIEASEAGMLGATWWDDVIVSRSLAA